MASFKIWNQAPLVRLLLPFLAGIITAQQLPFQHLFLQTIILPGMILLGLMVTVPAFQPSYKKSRRFGLLVNPMLFLLGFQLLMHTDELRRKDHFSRYLAGKDYVHARLAGPPVEKERSVKVRLDLLHLRAGERWMPVSGTVMAYISKSDASLKLAYGDELLLHAAFTPVGGPMNPGEYDYKSFLAHQNIFQQAYVKTGSWISTGRNSGSFFVKSSLRIRDHLLAILVRNHVSGDEFAVGAALLLGYEDKLESHLVASYSGTGALHVLSVSGLHVAIVYIVFSRMLFFLDRFKRGNIIKATLLIMLLWFYAALTGLSPSVLRASTMFSFVVFARAFKWQSNIYNTLAASAFLLLIIQPRLVMEVGFQLSYLAVAGIVYIHPKIYALMDVDNRLLDHAWQITSASLAAQLATFPIGLYYFHQFPNYFLPANLVVIPLSTLIIYLGICVFIAGGIPVIAAFLASCFSACIRMLNSCVSRIEQWPHSVLDEISVSMTDTCLMYAVIASLLFYSARRKLIYLKSAGIAFVLLLSLQVVEQHIQQRQKKIVIYHVPKTSAIDFITGTGNVLLTDSAFAKNESGLRFRVRPNWWRLGLSRNTIITGNGHSSQLIVRNNVIRFGRKTILLVKGPVHLHSSAKPVRVDLLILSGNARTGIAELLQVYDPGKIVFDSSSSAYRIRKWKEECEKRGLDYYSVTDSGALEISS